MARPTIQDIARRVGVSAAVVSHVINDRPGHVSAATRRRVREVIAALGYRPLGVVKSLRRRESRALGLVISDTTSALFAPVARGVEAVAAREGYQVLLVNAETLAAEREALAALAAHPGTASSSCRPPSDRRAGISRTPTRSRWSPLTGTAADPA